MEQPRKYFFCGVGGSGMSPLARLLAKRGHCVCGSDRSFDQGRNGCFFELLKQEGITLFPQDGSGIDLTIDRFVVTRAVEESIPDVAAARAQNISIQRRPELMAELLNHTRSIAVGGTGGKSTTTGMIGYILDRAGMDPLIVNGAVMVNYAANYRNGSSALSVFEADESDGFNDVISLCTPAVAVLTNISLDHFELPELCNIFKRFLSGASEGIVINADCPNSKSLMECHARVRTFGIDNAADVMPKDLPALPLPGKHNLANGLAAIAACSLVGIEMEQAADILANFQGIERRLQLIGEIDGIRVIDDFASNPAKLTAALATLTTASRRLIAIFQPHGFQPAKMMRQGYVEVFTSQLRPDDLLVMPEIYYVGGTANYVQGKSVPLPQDISSVDLINDIKKIHDKSFYFKDRKEIVNFVKENALRGDTIVVMGSRDETLPEFARQLYTALQ